MNNILELRHISKSFGDVKANNDINFTLREGEILALLGENGSGKTSLMNIIAGIYTPDEGQIYIQNKEVQINTPKDALVNGIGMVHQHFKLVDVLTARENIVLGLTNENYEEFYGEQLEKVKAKEDQFGKLDDLRKLIKNLKQQIKSTDNEKEKEEYQKLLTDAIKRYNKVKDYHRYARRSKGFSVAGQTERINNMAEKYGFDIDPNKKVYNMSVSEKQTIEIMKVLYRGVDVLILDEPTAVLTPQEIDKLFEAVRNLKKAGKSIIIITHKLNEVMEISDRVAILRKGELIDVIPTSTATEAKLTEAMVGRKVDLNIERKTPVNPADRLFVKNISVPDKDGNYKVKDFTFTARGGEILGIAGIAGSGQKELLEAISGVKDFDKGEIIFQNPKKDCPVTLFHKTVKQIKELSKHHVFYNADTHEEFILDACSKKEIMRLVEEQKIVFYEDEVVDLKHKNPQEIRELGIRLSFVPEDRLGMGLVADMNITDNMMLRSYRKGKGMFLHTQKPHDLAVEVVKDLEVVTPDLNTPVRKLSGGNIQKVLVGREISFTPKVLMAAYPVRGLDINSSYAIYDLLNKQKERGVAVIFVGEDLDVLLALSDRILVMCNGEVSGIVDARKTSKRQIGALMTKVGGKEND